MRNCSPVPVVPPSSRFPRHTRPRKAVTAVNGIQPGENGNVDVGDVKRFDFVFVEVNPKMNLDEVAVAIREVVGKLKGTAIATVVLPLCAFDRLVHAPITARSIRHG